MKNTTNISLVIVYTIFTIGVAISSHYCLGKVSHQDFFSYDNHGCLCDELTNNEDDCCKDEVEVVVIDEDQRTFDQLVSIVPKLNILFEFEFNVLEELGLYQRLEAVYYDYPPPKQQPLYSLNSNYTFYG